MKIIVCVKVINGELNPFDECALEAALSVPGSEVTVLSMGPASCLEKLKAVSRLGTARVILVSDSAFAGSDTLATSYILCECIKKMEYDAIFCGRQTVDGDTAQVGPCLAAMLGINPVTNVMSLIPANDGFSCVTRMGSVDCTNPSLLTIERINTLRFPSIRSKEKGVEIWDNSFVGADISKCGYSGSPTKVLKVFENTAGMRKCKFIERDELVPLIKRLRNESRKKTAASESSVKLPTVWAIGQKVEAAARTIAENVVTITETDPYLIAEKIKREKPETVLWNADLCGRRNAPITAALVNTGLCADCTALETDGSRLYMYRPARSGNVTAKIRCDSMPQMATVRTEEKSDDVIVSAGRGVSGQLDRVRSFADDINAKMCSSRALVDMGLCEYECQVGLTGKNVCPKIYIAIGISGAVHHTVGIENAGIIIAVNPDKKARIFDYADYGIVGEF